MKANNTPANVSNLLTAAAYVRNETIINGNQAAQLDAMIGQIKDLTAKIEAVPAKIADLAAQGKEKAVAMWERMAARYKAQFADAVAGLRAWLVDFKTNRPNVQINLDEPEDPAPATNNTPTTMNANEINARRAANEFVNAPTHRVNTVDEYGNEMSCPAWGLDMAEAIAADHRAKFPNDTTEIVEQENCCEIQAYWDKEYAKTLNA